MGFPPTKHQKKKWRFLQCLHNANLSSRHQTVKRIKYGNMDLTNSEKGDGHDCHEAYDN